MPHTTTIDWTEMLKTHEPWLRKVLRCRISDAHAVDDLFQEIAVAVFRQLDPAEHVNENGKTESRQDRSSLKKTLPQNPEKVGPWLYRVAIRQAINFHRKQARKSQPKFVEDLTVQAPTPEPLDWLLHQEAGDALSKSIEKLNDGDREILMLKFTENWSYQQLAEHLGISARAVEHRLLKARKTLRKLLVASELQLGDEHDG